MSKTPVITKRSDKPTKKLTDFFATRPRGSSGSSPASSSLLQAVRPERVVTSPPTANDALDVTTKVAKPLRTTAGPSKSTQNNTSARQDKGKATVHRLNRTHSRGDAPLPQPLISPDPMAVDPIDSIPLRRSARKASAATLPTPSTSPTAARKGASAQALTKRKIRLEDTPKVLPSKAGPSTRASAQRGSAAIADSARTLPPQPKDNVAPPKTRAATKTSPRKRRKLSSPPAAPASTRIASSLSDEEEMSMAITTPKNAKDVARSVDKWRRQHSSSCVVTSPSRPQRGAKRVYALMDVDSDTSLPPLTSDGEDDPMDEPKDIKEELRKAAVARQLGLTRSSSRSSMLSEPTEDSNAGAARPVTPPPASLPSVKTPKPLDIEAKTAKLIADIKAKAYEAQDSSDEEPRAKLVLRDLEDSESEPEDLFAVVKNNKGKGKAKATVVAPSSKQSATRSPATRPTRYALRNRDKASPEPPSDPRLSSPVDALPSFLAPRTKPKKRTKESDPLEFLLREKRAADKRGNGAIAFQRAEDTLARMSMRSSDAEDEDSAMDVDWADEEAARRAVREGARMGWSSASPPAHTPGRSSDAEDMIEEEDRERLLGKGRGKAVGRILEKDRAAAAKKGQGKVVEKDVVLGVPLWQSPSVLKDPRAQPLVGELPPFGASDSAHLLVCLLKAAVEGNDTNRLTAILNSGVVSRLETEDRTIVLAWLIDLVLSDTEARVIEAALCVLPSILSDPSLETVSILPALASMLRRLGATEEVLSTIGNPGPFDSSPRVVAFTTRADAVYSFVALATQFARAMKLPFDDIASVAMSLVILALDVESSSSRKRDVMVALDFIGKCIPADPAGQPSRIEQSVAERILAYAASLTPANQAHLLSLFAGGCPQTARIARWVAQGLLLGDDVPVYSPLLSLEPLREMLSGIDGPRRMFEVDGNTDYEDLGFYVDLLAVALTNVNGYVAEERRLARLEKSAAAAQRIPADSPGRLKADKPPTTLEAIRAALDSLHGDIVDTRAAHLDRSRAKAAIQRLSMRIHYQRLAAPGAATGVVGKPRRIGDFFPPPATPVAEGTVALN